MSADEEVTVLQERLTQAESARDAWRAAGRQEKYEEAYFIVEAIQNQIEACWIRRNAALKPEQRGG